MFNSDGDAPTWIENLGGGTFASPVQFAPSGDRLRQLDALWITNAFSSVDGEVRWARCSVPISTDTMALADFTSNGVIDKPPGVMQAI